MDERYFRRFNAKRLAQPGHIPHLFYTLLVRGVGNDGSIGEEQEFRIIGKDAGSDMGEDPAFREDTSFLVKHGVQQVVGVDKSFHQHVGLSLAHQCHSLAGCIVAVVGCHETHMVGMWSESRIGPHLFLAAHKNGIDELFVESPGYGILSGVVGGAYHCYSFSSPQLGQMCNKLLKIGNGFHNVRFCNYSSSTDIEPSTKGIL